MFRKILRFSFIPTSFFFWFLYNYATLENGSASDLSLFSLIALLGIYALIIFNFFLKRFNLKVKTRWFFYFFLATTTLILILETVAFFFKNFVHTFEFNPVFELFAFLLLASWGISFILSLSFGIKMFFNKKLIRKVDLKKLTHRLKTTKSIALLSLLVVAGFLFSALTQNALFKDFLGIKTNQESVKSSSIAPTSIPTPTSTEVIQEEKYIAPTNDPDPIIECQNSNCGSIKIHKSLCSDTTGYVCCQIRDKWIWYASRSKCTEDQARSASTQTPPQAGSNVSDKTELIKVLQDTLRKIKESNALYLQDLEKLSDYSEAIIADYEKGLISYEEFKTRSDKTIPAIKELTSWIEENQKKRENYENLIRRFERGENVPMEEFKTLLGH